MRDRLRSFPELRIFCQNVNRNYGYMDTLLSSLYDEYDLLFFFFFGSTIYNAVLERSPRESYKHK